MHTQYIDHIVYNYNYYCYYILRSNEGAEATYISYDPGDQPRVSLPTLDAVSAALQNTAPPIGVLEQLFLGGEAVEVEPVTVSGPAQIQGETLRETQVVPNAQTGLNDVVETVTTTVNNLTYSDNRVTNKPTTTTTYVNGRLVSTQTQPLKPPNKPPTNSPNTPKPPTIRPDVDINLLGCGLPNTPKCRIDEDGTPSAVDDTHKSDIDDELKGIRDLADNPRDFWPEFRDIEWAFRLPTGCSAVDLPGFAPFIPSINVCKIQPVIHDLLSVVWILSGILGSIGIFWRSVFAQSS